MKSTYSIKTFGCKVNTYDSGLLQKKLEQSGFSANKDGEEEIHIVNTCAVTAEATREAIRHIRRIKKKKSRTKVVVTGCAAQVDGEKLKIPEVDLLIANSHKAELDSLLVKEQKSALSETFFRSNIFEKEDYEFGGGLENQHTRSFLKIQDGCNSFCTYCVIPFARGKSRSIPISKIVAKANELYEQGVQEIVITGVHIADYASFKNESITTLAAARSKTSDKLYYLEDLVESLLKETRIPRYRLSSLEPGELSPRLLELYKDSRMCPHFHMSIQSACSPVLFAMKRKYSAKSVEESLNAINKQFSNAFVGMDIIVGFPGESLAYFEETYERLQSLDWTRIHVFPYSDRPGTKAMDYGAKVFHPELGKRANKMRQLSEERFLEKAKQQIGLHKKCLILKDQKKDFAKSLSRDFWKVNLPDVQGEQLKTLINSEVNVEILSYVSSSNKQNEISLKAQIVF